MVRLLIGVTGSVATIKLTSLIETILLFSDDTEICVVSTGRAMHFIPKEILRVINDPAVESVLAKKPSSLPVSQSYLLIDALTCIPIYVESDEWQVCAFSLLNIPAVSSSSS